MKKDKQVLYFYMISVTISFTLIALAIMRYIVVNEPKGYLIILVFVITFNYIIYLEKKAGISKKVIWVRNSLYMVLVALTYFLYF